MPLPKDVYDSTTREWQTLKRLYTAFALQEAVEGRVARQIRHGLLVELTGLGVPAFLPRSQVSIPMIRDLSPYVGVVWPLRIIAHRPLEGLLVVSRRVLLEEERSRQRAEALAGLSVGDVCDGVVVAVVDYGVFVEIDAIGVMLPVAGLGLGQAHPSTAYAVRQAVRVKILRIDRGRGVVSGALASEL